MLNLDTHILGRTVGVNAITSVLNDVPLLGVADLEAVGIEVDRHNQAMKRFLFTRRQRL